MKYTVLIALCTLCCPYVAGVVFTNSWALLVSGDAANVDNVAKKYGFLNLGKVSNSYCSLIARSLASRCNASNCLSYSI